MLKTRIAGTALKLHCMYSVIGALQDTFLLSRVQKVPYRAPNTLYIQCSFNAVPEMRVFSGALLPGLEVKNGARGSSLGFIS